MQLSCAHLKHLLPRQNIKSQYPCIVFVQPPQSHAARSLITRAVSDAHLTPKSTETAATTSAGSQRKMERPASRIATDRPDQQRPEDNPDLDDLVLDEAYYEEMGLTSEDVMEQLAWDPADVDPESYDIDDRPGSRPRPGSRQPRQDLDDDDQDVEVQIPMGSSNSNWADGKFEGGMGGMTLEEMGELSDDMPMDLREHLMNADVYGPPVSCSCTGSPSI